ncbi:MAG: lipase family protein [Amphritea sp.]|nr:lipase family protein [Amphritea sp.]
MQINGYTTGLDQTNALTMARLSQLVYIEEANSDKPDESAILAELKQACDGYHKVTGYDNSSAQAMLVEHEEYLAVVCRGTDEWKDWIDNIRAFPQQALFGEFHRGFWESVEDLWPGINNDLVQARKIKARPLFIAGHSLGGAMASIIAAKLIHEDRPFTSVYTFGQPRAMTRDTARIFNVEAGTRHHRFQNNQDIVTRVPARLMNYSHVGRCIYIDGDDGSLHIDPGYWFRFLDIVQDTVETLVTKIKAGAIADHAIEEYIKAIQNWKMG